MSLDPRHQLVVMELLRRASRMTAAPCWRSCTTSRWPRALPTASLVMDRGRLVADGAPREVLTPARIAAVFGVEAVIADTGVGRIPMLRRPL